MSEIHDGGTYRNLMSKIHGGDIYRNFVSLDFSINVNPLGVPESVKTAIQKAAKNCSSYPDIEAERLKQAVGRMLDVPKEYLIFGNGSSELLLAVVHALNPRKIVIPVPSFYGYEYAANAAEGEIVYYDTRAEDGFCVTETLCEMLTEDVGLLFLANPNNPTGNLMQPCVLKQILNHCRNAGIYVVLDECFIEFCGKKRSMIPEIAKYDNLILIQAFTKSFSIPGVRLGYLICSNKGLLHSIRRHVPEWNLSCFAHAAGCACARETDYIRKTKDCIEKERQFLEEELKNRGYFVFPSDANFILCYTREPLYQKLLERGILIRDCRNFRGLHEGYYRIAVKSRKENEMLLQAMDDLTSDVK